MNGKRLAAAAAITLSVTAAAGPAGADPTRGPSEQLTLVCDGLGTIDIATNGNSDWTPGLLVGSTTVLVPYAFHFEFTPTGSTETFTDDVAKPKPRSGRYDRCTFSVTVPDGAVSGIAWVTVAH